MTFRNIQQKFQRSTVSVPTPVRFAANGNDYGLIQVPVGQDVVRLSTWVPISMDEIRVWTPWMVVDPFRLCPLDWQVPAKRYTPGALFLRDAQLYGIEIPYANVGRNVVQGYLVFEPTPAPWVRG